MPRLTRVGVAVAAGVLSVLAGVLSGCLGHAGVGQPRVSSPPSCVDPWPCGAGAEWPVGLPGPFALGPVQHVQVASFDGTRLDGWLIHPVLPAGVKEPVVLSSGPYWGEGYPTPSNDVPPVPQPVGSPQFADFNLQGHFIELAHAGYAIAIFNVRGTGDSGGCFDWFSPAEQRDQSVLVDWLGNQTWSNGRVAMMGYSYLGTTPLEAAVRNPRPLKAIVVAGIIPDSYLRISTPQGAIQPSLVATDQDYAAVNSIAPPVVGDPTHPDYWGPGYAAPLPDRACPQAEALAQTELQSLGTDSRPAAYWEQRRFSSGFPNITAAVLLGHGLQDQLQWEADTAWTDLAKAPKSQVFGQWGHQFPDSPDLAGTSPLPSWPKQVEAWLDFWLKGIGPVPGVGRVAYQDGTKAWHEDTAWPPNASHPEVLDLAPGALTPVAADGAASFVAAPTPGGQVMNEPAVAPASALCPPGSLSGTALVYASQPLSKATLVAGNPMAYLRLSSDMPGGVVAVNLFDAGPDFACTGPAASGVRLLQGGAADLRFWQGNLDAIGFPVGSPTSVRIDIGNLAEVLPPGHRLVLLVSAGDPYGWSDPGQREFPTITVHYGGGAAASQLVMPVAQGSLGGSAPTAAYPPRPFEPRAP